MTFHWTQLSYLFKTYKTAMVRFLSGSLLEESLAFWWFDLVWAYLGVVAAFVSPVSSFIFVGVESNWPLYKISCTFKIQTQRVHLNFRWNPLKHMQQLHNSCLAYFPIVLAYYPLVGKKSCWYVHISFKRWIFVFECWVINGVP